MLGHSVIVIMDGSISDFSFVVRDMSIYLLSYTTLATVS